MAHLKLRRPQSGSVRLTSWWFQTFWRRNFQESLWWSKGHFESRNLDGQKEPPRFLYLSLIYHLYHHRFSHRFSQIYPIDIHRLSHWIPKKTWSASRPGAGLCRDLRSGGKAGLRKEPGKTTARNGDQKCLGKMGKLWNFGFYSIFMTKIWRHDILT